MMLKLTWNRVNLLWFVNDNGIRYAQLCLKTPLLSEASGTIDLLLQPTTTVRSNSKCTSTVHSWSHCQYQILPTFCAIGPLHLCNSSMQSSTSYPVCKLRLHHLCLRTYIRRQGPFILPSTGFSAHNLHFPLRTHQDRPPTDSSSKNKWISYHSVTESLPRAAFSWQSYPGLPLSHNITLSSFRRSYALT